MDEYTTRKSNFISSKDMNVKQGNGPLSSHYEVNREVLSQSQNKMQESAFAQAYNSYQKEYNSLMGSKRVGRDDSKTMQDVKLALYSLNIYFSHEIPSDQNEFDNELNNMQFLYKNLVDKCQAYLDAHEGNRSFFGKGKSRKRMVANLKTRAKVEQECLTNRAKSLFQLAKETDEAPTWVNVLAEVRTSTITLDGPNPGYTFEHVGKNSSSILKITDKNSNKNFYVKDIEVNRDTVNECQYILDSGIFKDADKEDYTQEQKKLLKALVKILLEDEGLEDDELESFNAQVHLVNRLRAFRSSRKISFNDCLKEENKKDFFERIYLSFFKSTSYYSILEKAELTQNGHAIIKKNKDLVCKFFVHMLTHRTCTVNGEGAKIPEGANLSSRNVATRRMADMLGIGRLVVSSQMVKCQKNGQCEEGIVMEEAAGEVFSSVFDKKYSIDSATMLDFNSMELLDTICGQVDRNYGNFMVQRLPDGKISSPVCIDNDFSFGQLKYKNIAKYSFFHFKAFEKANGLCRLDYLDKALVDKLKLLVDNEEIVRYEMLDLLSKKEIDCLLDRMRGVLNTIQRTQRAKGKTAFIIAREDARKYKNNLTKAYEVRWDKKTAQQKAKQK